MQFNVGTTYFERLKSLTSVGCSGILRMSSHSFSNGKPITLNILKRQMENQELNIMPHIR